MFFTSVLAYIGRHSMKYAILLDGQLIYAKLIKKGYKTIEQVPSNLQAEVKYVLKELE